MTRWMLIGLGALLLVMPVAAAMMQGDSSAVTSPATTDYLALGLAVVGLILIIWTVRLIVRFRSLHADEATLEAIEGDEAGN